MTELLPRRQLDDRTYAHARDSALVYWPTDSRHRVVKGSLDAVVDWIAYDRVIAFARNHTTLTVGQHLRRTWRPMLDWRFPG